ncbi:MAG: hypothetical protein NC091_13640 [Bacteroides sp.]|nr:hypothetical protein [Bacteroides sp.]
MRRLKFLLPVFLLLGCILLCGCDLRNYIYTEDSLKKVAEKSLKKKYGEEFVIHNVWDRDQTRFFADCSPKDNRDAVFLATIYKNGKGVFDDDYPEAVVELEVDELLRDGFDEVFENCYVKSYVIQFYTRPEFDSPRSLTLETYLEATNTRIGCYVFVENSDISKEDIEREYQYLSETLPNDVKEGGITDGQFRDIRIYFVDKEVVEKCETYFLTHMDIRGEFDSETSKYIRFSDYYENGKLSQSYEEYWETRKQSKMKTGH